MSAMHYVAIATMVGLGRGYYIVHIHTYMRTTCIVHALRHTLINLLYYIKFEHCINNPLLDLQFSLWDLIWHMHVTLL